jgi:hypothetical protein
MTDPVRPTHTMSSSPAHHTFFLSTLDMNDKPGLASGEVGNNCSERRKRVIFDSVTSAAAAGGVGTVTVVDVGSKTLPLTVENTCGVHDAGAWPEVSHLGLVYVVDYAGIVGVGGATGSRWTTALQSGSVSLCDQPFLAAALTLPPTPDHAPVEADPRGG